MTAAVRETSRSPEGGERGKRDAGPRNREPKHPRFLKSPIVAIKRI